MTREEAIRELKAMYEHILPHMSIMGTEAYDMAIKALEQQPCEKCEVGNPCLYCEYDFTEKKTKESCEDCISREEAINAAIDAVDEWDGGCNTNRATMISHAIKDLPSVTPQARWIPCSERLPKRDVDVLTYHRNESFDYQYVSWIDESTGKWAGFIGNLSDEVIAWMPLPKPYSESEGE